MNINAAGVKQISAGADGNDNFTNATTTQNTATINLGSSSASSSNQVTLATNLVHNFTNLNILPYNELDLSATATFIMVAEFKRMQVIIKITMLILEA